MIKHSTLSAIALIGLGIVFAKTYDLLEKKSLSHFFATSLQQPIETNNIWKNLHRFQFDDMNPEKSYNKLVDFYNPSQMSYFFGKSNVKIAYKTFLGRNPNKAIVLLTGRGESSLKYSELIYNLNGLGYTIYTYDHRGQGFSDRLIDEREVGYVDNFHDYVDDLKIFYDTIVKPASHQELYLIAHSMGGGIATLFLQENPASFTKSILLSPMHEINTGAFPEWAAKTLGNVNSLIGRNNAYTPNGQGYNPNEAFIKDDCTHSLRRFNYKKHIYKNFPQIRLGGASYKWLSESINATNIMKANAAYLTTPTLIIEAEGDTVVINQAHKQICDNAPKCSLTTITGAWHETYFETDEIRDEVLKNIVQFVLKP